MLGNDRGVAKFLSRFHFRQHLCALDYRLAVFKGFDDEVVWACFIEISHFRKIAEVLKQ